MGYGYGYNKARMGSLAKKAGAGAPLSLIYNIKPTNIANFRAAFRSGVTTRIGLIGDSTFRGISASTPATSQFPNGLARQLAAYLNAKGIAAGSNNILGIGDGTSDANSMTVLAGRDSRFAFGGATTVGSQSGGGAGFSLPSSGSFFTMASLDVVTKADIWDRNAGTGNGYQWSVDGGSATVVSQTGAFQMRKTTIALGAAAQHTVKIEWNAGNPTIYGINMYDDRRAEVQIVDFSIAGGDSARLIDNTGSPSAGRPAMYTTFGIKLALIELGVINCWRGSMSVSTFKTGLTSLVTTLKAANIDVILWVPPYDGSPAGLTSNQDAYVAAMYQVCDEQDVGLIDIRKRWLYYANQVGKGFISDAPDYVHPLLAGYKEFAQVAGAVIESIL